MGLERTGLSESVKGSEHRCLVEITIRERGSSKREASNLSEREGHWRELGFEESREQMRKREGRERNNERGERNSRVKKY